MLRAYIAGAVLIPHDEYKLMSNKLDPKTDLSHPMVYRIRLGEQLGSQWTDWFEDLTITQAENGETLLTGPVVDQAALHGLLRKVRDLGLSLVSVVRIEPEQADVPDAKP
jgi:hypothetical protein